jgi:hypothetical protein
MRTPEVERQRARLTSLIARVGHTVPLKDIEMQAHWARYLCILVAGFLEVSLRLLFSAYARHSASPRVHRYVESRLKSLQNPKAETVEQLAGQFDPGWQTAIKLFLEAKGRKDAIDSIMANRHLIAHGRDSGITTANVNRYFLLIVEVLEELEGQLGL